MNLNELSQPSTLRGLDVQQPASSVPHPAHPVSSTRQQVRFLNVADIPALLELEHAKWEDDQAASAAVLQQRIEAYPEWCAAAFCSATGKMLASLFVKPISEAEMRACATWADAAQIQPTAADATKQDMFGISMSSINKEAVENLFMFFIPRMVRAGKRHVYLGSPMPGVRKWCEKNPRGDVVNDYGRAMKNGLPMDPQLRYYHKKAFNQIIAIKPEYFPHRESLNYGAVLRMTLPLTRLHFIWKWLPASMVQEIFRRLSKLL